MNRLNFVIRRRSKAHIHEPEEPGRTFQALAISVLMLFSLLLLVLAFISALLYSQLSQDLPNIMELENLLAYPDGLLQEPTRFYDRSGEVVIYTLKNPDLGETTYHQIVEGGSTTLPDDLLNAVIAAVDPRFREHAGFDLSRLSENSSIAERLVQDLVMWDQPENMLNPWKIRLLALQATDMYGQDTLLEWFLNSSYMGNYLLGVEAAAQVYLGKPASDVSLAEAALLAAIIEAPALNPIDAPLAALDNQQAVLQRMVQYGFISEQEALEANAEPINIVHTELEMDPFVETYILAAIEQIETEIPSERLILGGYQVITSLDYELQSDTYCMSVIHLSRLELQQADYSLIEDCPTSGLLPRLSEEALPNAGDLAAETILYDPQSAEVLAYVSLNPQKRIPQPGTVVTPFLYLTAFTRGMAPGTMIWDLPHENLEGVPEDFLGPVRMRIALANDLLAPIFTIYSQVGLENAFDTYKTIGMPDLDLGQDTEEEIVLTNGAADIFQVAQAYGTLSNSGSLTGIETQTEAQTGGQPELSPVFVLKVTDYARRTVYAAPQKTIRPVTTAQLAYLVTDVLSDPYARLPGSRGSAYLEIGRPVAVKTSRTSDGSDVWTAGYSPDLVSIVWVGGNSLEVSAKLQPVVSSSLWRAAIQNALSDLPYQDFEEPANISKVEVCEPSGGLPTGYCPTVVKEIFLSGQEPINYDNLFQPVQINQMTGKLATIFTPANQIIEEIYMILPADALEWAEATGVRIPPEDYDIVLSSTMNSGSSLISSPAMFTYVNGTVSITGTAEMDDFNFYRVQVGQGLNPREWFQVGEAVYQQVTDNTLIEWDTTSFNGLYAVQLLVVNSNNQVETASVQVTVDNIMPELNIYYPADGEIFSYPSEREITLQADASDNVGIEMVEFLVDGEVVFQIENAPYLYPWSGTRGSHQITVRVTDMAGNVVEKSIEITVSED